MERTSYSILNENVLSILIKKFGLKPTEESNFFRAHWWVGNTQKSVNLFVNGIYPYMYYTIFLSSYTSRFQFEDKEIYIFEYEDIKKAIDEVSSFVKMHS